MYKITPIIYSVHRKGDNPVFGESSIHVSLEDDGAGEFIVIRQSTDDAEKGVIRLDFEEIPLISEAVELLKKGLEQNVDDQ